jgi:hypothetical protein
VRPLDLHSNDIALPQRPARDDVSLAVDLGSVALAAPAPGARPAVVEPVLLKKSRPRRSKELSAARFAEGGEQ